MDDKNLISSDISTNGNAFSIDDPNFNFGIILCSCDISIFINSGSNVSNTLFKILIENYL